MKAGNRPYEVVYEPGSSDSEFTVPEELEDEIEILHYNVQKGKPSAREKLVKMIQRYPKLPLLRNYLVTWHANKGHMAEAWRVNDELLRLFPGYLFAMTVKVQQLMEEGRPEEAGNVYRNKVKIEELFPHRKAFHLSEIRSFSLGLISWLSAAHRFEEAEAQLAVLKEVELDNEFPGHLEKMIFSHRIRATQERFSEMEKQEIKAQERTETTMPQATVTLERENEHFSYLYDEQWEIDEERLLADIDNNREALVAELQQIVRNAIEGFEFMKAVDYWSPAVMHAMLILPYLDEEAAFAAAIELYRQPSECAEYWIMDWDEDLLSPLFKDFTVSKLQQIHDLLIERPGARFNKITFVSMLPKFAARAPERRPDLIRFIGALLEYYAANRDDDKLFDTGVIAFAISAATDLKATELLPLIKDLFDKGWVSLSVGGNYEEVRNRLEETEEDINVRFHDDVFAHINHLRQRLAANESKKDELFMERLMKMNTFEEDMPAQAIKAPKNAPCPCGSGKKFKRCHGR